MKIRYGFVSNSSSSSFTCDVCGRTETSYDTVLEDMDFYQCENEHIFCMDEVIGGSIEELDNDYIGSCVSIKNCPICIFQYISNTDAAEYLFKKYNISREQVLEEIKKVNKRRKKLYDFEYVKYVFTQENITEDSFLKMLKENYKDYSEYRDFLVS